jgi:tetratricopeptide (TPR) repeat protein
MRRLLPLCLLFAACTTLSTEDARRLEMFQRNASYYWDGNNLLQADAMIDKGLEIDSADYKLNTMKGMLMLRIASSSPSGPQQDKKVDLAVAQFEKVFATRSINKHDRPLLLGYGLALQRQGMRHLAERDRLTESAARPAVDATARKKLTDDCAAAQKLAEESLRKSQAAYQTLLDRGELLMLSHYQLLQVHTILGEYEGDHGAFRHADLYLEQTQKAKEVAAERIKKTPSTAYERFEHQEVERVEGQELDVRLLVANIRRDRKEYDKALSQLDVILAADPTRSENYYNRGQVLLAMGRDEAAKADFRKFLATSPLPASSSKKAEAAKALGIQ